jgi:hypothetical protein
MIKTKKILLVQSIYKTNKILRCGIKKRILKMLSGRKLVPMFLS